MPTYSDSDFSTPIDASLSFDMWLRFSGYWHTRRPTSLTVLVLPGRLSIMCHTAKKVCVVNLKLVSITWIPASKHWRIQRRTDIIIVRGRWHFHRLSCWHYWFIYDLSMNDSYFFAFCISETVSSASSTVGQESKVRTLFSHRHIGTLKLAPITFVE